MENFGHAVQQRAHFLVILRKKLQLFLRFMQLIVAKLQNICYHGP